MLRIIMSVSGEGATKVFRYCASNFQSTTAQSEGNGEVREQKRLGLQGDVNRKDFIALASNKRPGTDETLTVRMKTTRREANWSSTKRQISGSRRRRGIESAGRL